MEFFRGKRERSVLNRGGADIKWNSPMSVVDPLLFTTLISFVHFDLKIHMQGSKTFLGK